MKPNHRRLIINADGFGFTYGINRAIRECAVAGTVTSTSCVTNFPAISEVRELQDDFPHLSIGVHFNLTVGRPVLPPDRVPPWWMLRAYSMSPPLSAGF